MPSEPDNQEDVEEKQKRITVKLDEFDRKVVSKMTANRNTSLSHTMRNIVHQWIEDNPDVLKRNYGIDVGEISERLALETVNILLDKRIKPYEKVIIKELPQFFEMVEDVSLEDLAERFDVNVKAIKNLIFTHSQEIKQVGLTLKYKENRIYKI
jgi:DNA-directed RNA polymerase specialized sigma24 family protein